MNRTRPAYQPQSWCLNLTVAVIIGVGASAPAAVLACGFCATPGVLKIAHPRSLDVAVAIRRDLDSGILKRTAATPKDKTERHYRDLQAGRILAERLLLREGFELLLIEDGSHYRIEGRSGRDLQKRETASSIRWVTGRDVLLALLERQLDLNLAVERGLIILEKTSVETRSGGYD